MKLSPKYTVDDWRRAFEDPVDWQLAADIVEDRINGRLLRWIDRLIRHEFAGFVALALDCLLLETLWGFLNGKAVPRGKAKDVYLDILTAPPFSFSRCQAEDFYENVRCGIIHDTETRKGWLIRMTPQREIVEKDPSGAYILNRTMFHKALKEAFQGWLAKLRDGDTTLRENMRCRMDEIVRKHYAASQVVDTASPSRPL